MATYYTVVQYVPDALADERINIGVIACDEHHAVVEFLNDWRRVRCFSGRRDYTFLREFSARIAAEVEPLPLPLNGALGHGWDVSRLEEVSRNWGESVQFTPLRASLQPAGELIGNLAGWFLHESIEVRTQRRDKRKAVTLASDAIRHTVALRFGRPPSNSLPQGFPIEGLMETQRMDLVVKTRRPLCGVQVVSFEIKDLVDLQNDLGASKWTMLDVRQRQSDFPMALVHFPPHRGGERATRYEQIYQSTHETMRKLNVDFVPDSDLPSWAEQIVDSHITEWQDWLDYARATPG